MVRLRPVTRPVKFRVWCHFQDTTARNALRDSRRNKLCFLHDVTNIPSYLRPWNPYFRCWTPRHSVGPQKCRWHKSWIAGVIFPNPSFLWHPHPVINIVRVISERLHNSAWFSTRPMGYIIHEDQFVIFKFQGGQDYDDCIFQYIRVSAPFINSI